MTYNEADHPRDEKGRWTNASGIKQVNENSNDTPVLKGRVEKTQKTPAEILYGKTGSIKTKEKEESAYRNALLNTLGKLATPAVVLYSKTKDLEKMVKENGLVNKARQKFYEAGLRGPIYNNGGYWVASKMFDKDTMGMIDLAHEESKRKNLGYEKDAIELKNFDDPRVASDKKYLVKKLNEQFKDYTQTFNIEEVKGYFFKNNSEPSIRISQDIDFRKLIKDKKYEIQNNKDVSGYFRIYKDKKESNLGYAIGHYDLRNSYIDKEGNLHTKVYDTYDFNKENKTPLNQAGRSQMLKGNLKPYYTIHDIIIPKNQLNKIWND